ncbi:MAG TPA: 50S ribosomal protein L9 [Candidatus Absconditabacterales bacterium]|nr:50S ribosomal protein L9 [Candidatus Absconditabacterales bacterium]
MQKIDVLLLQDFKTLGKKYDVIGVKPIYARNVLFPQGIARLADKGTLNDLRSKIASHQKSQQTLIDKLKAMLASLQDTPVVIKAQANESGKLYGKIHATTIADKLSADYGCDVSSDYLHINDIESVGLYTINFHGLGIQSTFQCDVVGE